MSLTLKSANRHGKGLLRHIKKGDCIKLLLSW